MVGFLALVVIMAAIVIVLWRVWVAREDEAVRAAEARAQATEWKQLVRGSDGVAHDVNNLLAAAFINLEDLWSQVEANPEEAELSVRDVTQAIQGATELLTALRQNVEGHERVAATTEGHVRLQLALLRSQASFLVEIDGDLVHGEQPGAAARVVQNLFHNAVREAELAGGEVRVRLTNDVFEITNAVRDPGTLGDEIYERGVSASGSSGTGLTVARQQANIAGWALSHELNGAEVTFRCRRAG